MTEPHLAVSLVCIAIMDANCDPAGDTVRIPGVYKYRHADTHVTVVTSARSIQISVIIPRDANQALAALYAERCMNDKLKEVKFR